MKSRTNRVAHHGGFLYPSFENPLSLAPATLHPVAATSFTDTLRSRLRSLLCTIDFRIKKRAYASSRPGQTTTSPEPSPSPAGTTSPAPLRMLDDRLAVATGCLQVHLALPGLGHRRALCCLIPNRTIQSRSVPISLVLGWGLVWERVNDAVEEFGGLVRHSNRPRAPATLPPPHSSAMGCYEHEFSPHRTGQIRRAPYSLPPTEPKSSHAVLPSARPRPCRPRSRR